MSNLFKGFQKLNLKRTIFFAALLLPSTAWTQIGVEYDEEIPHHFSILTGGTEIIDDNLTGFTLGGELRIPCQPFARVRGGFRACIW